MALALILNEALDDTLVAKLDIEDVGQVLFELDIALLLFVYLLFRFLQ